MQKFDAVEEEKRPTEFAHAGTETHYQQYPYEKIPP
jgi:hypothetical protein